MKVNLNDKAVVTLTAYGAGIYNDYMDQFPEQFRAKVMAEGDVLRDQIWSLFSIFGPHIGLGLQSPFHLCEIEITGNPISN